MADGYDRFENESGGGSFVMGLLTGTVLGAGLGMLFAPKAGSELRNKLSEQAGNIANTASEGYRRATESASDWADRGKQAVDKARDAVSKGVDEAQRYVRDATGAASDVASTPSGSPMWSGSGSQSGTERSETIRGGSHDPVRGTGSGAPGGRPTEPRRG
jgi:gas vesicle protein